MTRAGSFLTLQNVFKLTGQLAHKGAYWIVNWSYWKFSPYFGTGLCRETEVVARVLRASRPG
jgi:hypothetical protein